MPELPEATLKAAVEVDHVDHEALVATPLLSAEIVGECRFIRLPDQPDTAEVGVTVVDAWQGRGLGSALLARLSQHALQAGIAACHARARTPEETDWARIVNLYAELARLAPSPVVELNRAVALAMAYGPAAGLELVDELSAEPFLKDYHLLPSVRGDLLGKLGRFDEAAAEFERAASLTRNVRERELLLERAASCAQGKAPAR